MGRIHGIYWSVETRIENEGKKALKGYAARHGESSQATRFAPCPCAWVQRIGEGVTESRTIASSDRRELSGKLAAHGRASVNGIARGNFAIQKKPWTSGERKPAPFACRFGRDVPFRSRRLNHSDLRIADVVSVIFLVHHVGFRHVEARISTSASLPTIQFRACGNHGQAAHIAARHVNDWIHAVIEM